MVINNREYIYVIIIAIFVLLFVACAFYIISLIKTNKRLGLLNSDVDILLKRYSAIFNTKSVGIKYFDKNGYLTDINAEACSILGVKESPEDFVKRRINYKDFKSDKLSIYKSGGGADIIGVELDNSKILDNISAGCALDGNIEYDLTDSDLAKVILANGREYLVLNVNIIPVIIDGKVDGFISMFSDITEQIKKQRDREKRGAIMTKAFDNLPISILLKDTKIDEIIYRNEVYDTLFEEDIFSNPSIYIDSEHLELLNRNEKQILETGELMIYRSYMKLKSGKQIEYTVHKSVFGDAEDGILLIAVIESSIVSELEKTNKIFSIQSGNVMAYTWDYNLSQNKMEFSNHATFKEMDTLDFFLSILSEKDRQKIYKLLDDVRNGLISEAVYEYSIFNSEQNRREYWESRVIREDVNVGGEIQMHLYGIDVDITDRVEFIKELKEAKNIAEEANSLKSMFLANMSHEIRTPLNAIVGFSDLIVDAETREDRETFSNIINTNSKILLDLINSILDVSKIEAGGFDVAYEVFDISKVINNLILFFKQGCEKNDLQIYSEMSHDALNIEFERKGLVHIITNFMSNAVKFTTKGSIVLGYTYSDERLRVYVKDTGVGIKESDIDKVFNRFKQLNDFAQGTGLGMYICKAITNSLSGTIGVESEFGIGTTFWVEFTGVVSKEK